jgi:hypothetical protein
MIYSIYSSYVLTICNRLLKDTTPLQRGSSDTRSLYSTFL